MNTEFTYPTIATNPYTAPDANVSERLRPLLPEESARMFHVTNDLVFEQVLAEPIVRKPVFLTFDERGRMWVVQYLQYPNPAGLTRVSRDNYWRTVYDKVPPPPPHHFKGADKITIHEDTKGNGTFDKHKTFVDGLSIVTSVAIGRGGVFVLNPPYLLFYPDKNHDDVPDGDPEVLLSGFGIEDTHSVANSLRWGPDGWLYGCHGSTVTANITVHGPTGQALNEKPIYSQGQGIWRYHPEKRIYEIFAEGGGNAFGVEIDSAGRIFSGYNGGDTRGFHYMQGAYLLKGFDKHGPLSNPYAFGYFPPMKGNTAQRFTHNFVIYEDAALGPGFTGKLFGVEPLQGRIVMSDITRDGSTFRTHDLGYPVTSDDKWFRPVDIKEGPDGAIYVADWHDRQVSHLRSNEGQIDKRNGRIYRLRQRDWTPQKMPDLAKQTTRKLLDTSTQPTRTLRQQALRVLQERSLDAERKTLLETIGGANVAVRRRTTESTAQTALGDLRALAHAVGMTPDLAKHGLSSPIAQVREWTVRLIGDEGGACADITQKLASLAATEPNIDVRAQLACSAKRLPATDALPIIRALLKRDEDSADPRQPLLLWWAIESKCGPERGLSSPQQGANVEGAGPFPNAGEPLDVAAGWKARAPVPVLDLFTNANLWQAPIVHSNILSRLMRRFAATGKHEDLLTCARLYSLSPDKDSTEQLNHGFEEAYQGRPIVGLPEELLAAMEKAGGESLMIGARRGKAEAVQEALALIANGSKDTSQRVRLIGVFGETPQPAAVPVLLAAARDEKRAELCEAALGALQRYDATEIAADALKLISAKSPEIRAAAFGLLTSRPAWALALLKAVEAGTIQSSKVPTDVVQRLKSLSGETAPKGSHPLPFGRGEGRGEGTALEVRGEEIAKLTAKLWPNIRQATSAEMEHEVGRIGELLTLAGGNPYEGRKLFLHRCATCHKLFGKGGDVGPELTSFKRDDVKTLLLNIVNPSAEIREGYQSINIETKDGRTLAGFLAAKDEQGIVLRTAAAQTVALPNSEIESMQPSRLSLMPEGLLSNLSDQQLRDFFAYLRSSQPLNDAK